jgi:hypothetical protein
VSVADNLIGCVLSLAGTIFRISSFLASYLLLEYCANFAATPVIVVKRFSLFLKFA